MKKKKDRGILPLVVLVAVPVVSVAVDLVVAEPAVLGRFKIIKIFSINQKSRKKFFRDFLFISQLIDVGRPSIKLSTNRLDKIIVIVYTTTSLKIS